MWAAPVAALQYFYSSLRQARIPVQQQLLFSLHFVVCLSTILVHLSFPSIVTSGGLLRNSRLILRLTPPKTPSFGYYWLLPDTTVILHVHCKAYKAIRFPSAERGSSLTLDLLGEGSQAA